MKDTQSGLTARQYIPETITYNPKKLVSIRHV